MPGRTVTAKQDQVILELFGQCLQKNIGADGIAVWQHQKAAFTGSRLNGPIGIAIFADVMTWNHRPDTLFTDNIQILCGQTIQRFIGILPAPCRYDVAGPSVFPHVSSFARGVTVAK